MKIKDAIELIKSEKDKTLRKSKNLITYDPMVLDEVAYLQYELQKLFEHSLKSNGVLGRLIFKRWLSKFCIRDAKIVKSITGKGRYDKPFILITTYGSGEVFDARQMLEKVDEADLQGLINDGKGHCYHNSAVIAKAFTKGGIACKQITGLCFCKQWDIIHSVVKFNLNNKWYVLDYNFKYVMEADLYLKLFSFEPLCVIEGKDLIENEEFIREFKVFCLHKRCSFDDRELALAYDDIAERAKKFYNRVHVELATVEEVYGKGGDQFVEDMTVNTLPINIL